jgi:Response regulator containing CheY-like receiver, AAA-type ATPase, and DNA-binding domains
MMVHPDGTVLHLNQKLSDMTGFSVAQAEGYPCRYILRSRPCVSGCSHGCGSFGKGKAVQVVPLPSLAFTSESLQGRDSLETDILTLKKRRVPVRLTHFPVQDSVGSTLFFLDVVEDLTELKHLENRLHEAKGHGKLVGRGAAMEKILSLVASLAPSVAPVLITGETGTGKDILAETLHRDSHRSREPFIRINAMPLTDDLLAADLFGQVSPERADSGPSDRLGKFQQAAGGTLYIAELADISQAIQARLVHYLDTGTILPVGGVRELAPNVRLITATSRSPEELVKTGILSGELFYRLNVIRLPIPPLRERREDIDFLLRHFLEMFGPRFKKQLNGFTPEAQILLTRHDYPGNVRELRNIVEYAVMVCTGPDIGTGSLPAHFVQAVQESSAHRVARESSIEKGTAGSRKRVTKSSGRVAK